MVKPKLELRLFNLDPADYLAAKRYGGVKGCSEGAPSYQASLSRLRNQAVPRGRHV